MKAIIMEINKKYCIVMTEDGQFLKHRISGGSVEIGDGIIIEEKNNEFSLANYKKTWIRGLAVGFAVLVVLVVGSVFSYRFLKQYLPISSAPTVAAAKISEENLADKEVEKNLQSVPQEDSAERPLGESAAAEDNAETFQQSPLFEKVLLLKKENVLTEEHINGILFSYQVLSTEQKVLQVKIENRNDSLKFEGSILLEMMLEDGSITRQVMIELPGFNPGYIKEEKIGIENGETNFKLVVYGEFN
ncbi:MAG: anti-sigma factor domain-containing protein [Actinobacteria bacterium]|nr:anti-sigma factor domain-containing protein [Actinomycetota bacterium]MCG2788502.1 anti-sigma factor domain-containing protein [Actinomycetes bacterium]